MTNKPVWTEWLENFGNGECPVPEWAEDYSIKKRYGDTFESIERGNPAQKRDWSHMGDFLDITHYRYAVPADLAWLAENVSEWPWCIGDANRKLDESRGHIYTAADGKVDGYTKDQWLRARRDLGYESNSDRTMTDSQGMRWIKAEGNMWRGACVSVPATEENDPSAHYQGYQYKGIKLDPYRIARIYNMQGGPREQIMKKCLRFTDKGQTEREVVSEIRSALDRWEEMLEEDNQ